METGFVNVYKMLEILTMRRVSGRWSPKCKSKSPARYGRLGRSEVLCKTTGLGMLLVTVSMGMWAVKLYFSKIL